jgi:DNA repair exonuclease SbcCD nuclease subunit
MNFKITTNHNKKIGLFTDIHCGVEKDSSDRLKETELCFDWIIESFKQANVDWVFFLGDLFDSRFAINTKTLNTAISGIDKLSKEFELVAIILGNHDSYYKNTNDVNSIDFLEKVASKDNILIVSKEPIYFNIAGKTFGLYPWNAETMLFEENITIETCDYAFGHFEANGILQPGGLSTGGKTNLNDLYKFGNYIFSGHYHINKLYKSTSGKNALQMIGSPLQLNWSDYGLSKFIYTLNVCDDTICALENSQNAIYEKIFYSKLENKQYTSADLYKLCTNNYVKLVIDDKYEFNKIVDYLTMLKQYSTRTLETEYLISLSTSLLKNVNTASMTTSNSKTNLDYILEYIDNLYSDIEQVDGDINKDQLVEYAKTYFSKIENNK